MISMGYHLNTSLLNDSRITQCTFRLVSRFSLTLSLGHLFTEMCDTTKRWPSDKVKENLETNLKVHCVMRLSLSNEVFRWYPMDIML